MHSFNNIKHLVYARHCFWDIMFNDIDKISVVMEKNKGTMLEYNRV